MQEQRKHPLPLDAPKEREFRGGFRRNQPPRPVKQPQPPREAEQCRFCGKCHSGTQCWRKAGPCYICGSLEHQMRDCPKEVGLGKRRPLVRSKAFSMTHQDPQTLRDAIPGRACAPDAQYSGFSLFHVSFRVV